MNRGVALCVILGAIAYLLDDWLQSSDLFSLGSGTLAFIFGAICAQLIAGIKPGGDWVVKKILPITIICLGSGSI